MSTIESEAVAEQERTRRLAVYVAGGDQVWRAELAARLGSRPELEVVESPGHAAAAVLAVEEADEASVQAVSRLLRAGCPHVVLVSTWLDEPAVLRAVEAGASVVLRRSEAAPERLAAVLVAAVAGRGTLPPELLGSLLAGATARHSFFRSRGLLLNGFTEREIEVLRLVADGYDTAEISGKLAYSERTVKNVLHDVTSRFQLRNRCHAVAYALRAGVI